jgi:hypothetical protein
MRASEEYRHNAAVCLRIAEVTMDTAARMVLLDMATAWYNLADQAERNSRADLVYETPPPRPAQQPAGVQQQQQIQPKNAEPDAT